MRKLLLILIAGFTCSVYGQLTLENIWFSREFSPKFVAGFQYLNDGKSYCQLDKNADQSFACNRYDIKTGAKSGTLFSTDKILVDGKPVAVEGFSFSENEQKVIITNGFEQVYRHSGKSNTYLYDIPSGKVIQISNKKIMYATLSPDGNKVAYVSDNNLFYYDIAKNKDVQITKDGKKNEIINGAVDWVYEEEFTMSKGFEWSPGGQHLAYYRFDETKVPEFGMYLYGQLYPELEKWKYPKAGQPNSKVDVYIHTIGKKKSLRCETGSENDQYLPRIKWISDYGLTVQRLNRHQNKLEILNFTNEGKMAILYSEENKYYVEVNELINYNHEYKMRSENKIYYLSEKSGYRHLNVITISGTIGNKTINLTDSQITTGSWDIDEFLGIDEQKQMAYFTAGMDRPSERQLYSVNLRTKERKQITTETGWHSISFSPTFDYFVDNYSTLVSAPVILIKDAAGQTIRTLENNEALNNKLKGLNLGKVDFNSFTTSENVRLDYWRILPPDFDSTKKYPVLFFVYGGPGHQTVKNQWSGANYMWYQLMAKKGYIVISVDNRGSGGRGELFKKMTYLQLGKYETIDYIEAAKYFGGKSYVDKARIGIFGWSYGGFMASSCISKGADYFLLRELGYQSSLQKVL